MTRFPTFALAFALCAALAGCDGGLFPSGPALPSAASQYDYFPLQIGRVWEYRVDSVIYDFAPGGGISADSTSVWRRLRIADTLRDASNALFYVVERYERRGESAPWQYAATDRAARRPAQAIWQEGNLRYLRLIFPMTRGAAWDGNVWIDESIEITIAGERLKPFGGWRSRVDELDVPAVVGNFAFDSTLVVTEADLNSAIERRWSRSTYARGVGLAYREQWILDSQYCNRVPSPPDCLTRPWRQKAEKGFIMRQTLLRYE